MPIPEPSIYRLTNLTKEQQQAQLAACYGVSMPAELSFEEVNRMRQIVQSYDAARRPMTTTDLNNPPKEPYRYQKFPMMIYDGQKKLIVHSEAELQAASRDGWSTECPAIADVREEPLSAAYQAEANRVQSQLDTENEKRRPGRPRKDAA